MRNLISSSVFNQINGFKHVCPPIHGEGQERRSPNNPEDKLRENVALLTNLDDGCQNAKAVRGGQGVEDVGLVSGVTSRSRKIGK